MEEREQGETAPGSVFRAAGRGINAENATGMKLAYHTLNLAKRLYDQAATQATKDRIAHGFMRDDAEIVLEEMKRKLEGERE